MKGGENVKDCEREEERVRRGHQEIEVKVSKA